MLEWLIIGGGPQGLHIAAALLEKAGLSPAGLRILDPHAGLMEAWNRRASTVAMSHLRSPSVHNVDADPWSLERFAESWAPRGDVAAFAPPYSRPSTALFDAHARAVVARFGLSALHVQGAAHELVPGVDGWRVGLEEGRSLQAKRVVLALGLGGTERVPPWARPHLGAPQRWLQHVFDPNFDLVARTHLHRVAVVGGGISAAQLANRLCEAGRRVWLVSPHRLRRMQFDSSPQWLGPAKMARFSKQDDLSVRRRQIDRARRPGTMTKEVEQVLRRHVRQGSAELVYGKVRGVFALEDRRVLGLPKPLEVDAVALATGFEGLPGAGLLRSLDPERFPRAGCGTPIVDAQLQWADGLYLSGALAELQLGPVALNIAGGLRAAERLVPVAKAEVRRRRQGAPAAS
ncbi:MAG: FAD/NAD(P)-binding protein [Nannocystales bacterium]